MARSLIFIPINLLMLLPGGFVAFAWMFSNNPNPLWPLLMLIIWPIVMYPSSMILKRHGLNFWQALKVITVISLASTSGYALLAFTFAEITGVL